MDMVQVQDLDAPVKSLVQCLGSPSDLQWVEDQGRGLRHYAMSQKQRDIIQKFRDCHGITLSNKVQAPGRAVWVDLKRPFRLSEGVDLSARPDDLLVLIPLYEDAFCVQYKSKMSGEWSQLRWELGTYATIPGGSAVRVTPVGAVYGLILVFTWGATWSDRAEIEP